MKHNIHTSFILTPIIEILKESVSVCHCLGNGIETQPLCDYIMQSTFLKMTGASEQKLKCICWEMATYDYEYRYQIQTNPLGECSCFAEKKRVYNDMLDVISNLGSCYNFDNLFNSEKKNGIVDKIKDEIISTISDSLIEKWENRAFLFYKSNPSTYTKDSLFANRNTDKNAKSPYSFLENDLKKYYEDVVYRQRNRCAHNLKSYQSNLPTFSTLINTTYDYENYFHMISVLLLLDNIYMILYREYIYLLDDMVL